MNRRRLALLGGLLVAAVVLYRRRRRREGVAVAIDEPEPRAGTSATSAPSVDLQTIEGIGPSYAERLQAAGVDDATDLAAADAEDLAAETGIGERRIRGWIEAVEGREDA